MAKRTPEPSTIIPVNCPRCGIGRLQTRLVNYAGVVNGTLLAAPNFPARECDICHFREYDEGLLEQLELLLSLEEKPRPRPASTPRARKTPAVKTPTADAQAAPRKPKTPR